MEDIFNSKESILGRVILDWCMNHQLDRRAQSLYLKYFSKNSPRPINVDGYYFIEEDVMVEWEKREVALKRDKSKLPTPKPKLYKIPMDKKSSYKGYIIIMSHKTPMEVYEIMRKKNYRRNINAEPIRLFMNSFCPNATYMGESNEVLPENRLFVLVDKDIY